MNNQSQPEKWRIEYENDTGPHDEYFRQWWVVTDGNISYESRDETEAAMLMEILNLHFASPSTPNQSDEARKEIEELKEEIRKLRCWLKYNDWLKQNYELDDWSTNPGPHYFQKRDGKVIPFNISKPEMDIRREYIKLNNL